MCDVKVKKVKSRWCYIHELVDMMNGLGVTKENLIEIIRNDQMYLIIYEVELCFVT